MKKQQLLTIMSISAILISTVATPIYVYAENKDQIVDGEILDGDSVEGSVEELDEENNSQNQTSVEAQEESNELDTGTSETDSSISETPEIDKEEIILQSNPNVGPGFYDPNLDFGYTGRSSHTVNFLNNIKQGSLNGWTKHKILPSIVAAQAVLESGWGQSTLAINGNNLFGIKGRYNGNYIVMPTLEFINGQWITVNAEFRKYPNWDASVEDHGSFLNVNPRYAGLLGVEDYRTVARMLQEAGYATDPQYAEKLINIIEFNGLASWDSEVLSRPISNNSVRVTGLQLGTAQTWLDEIQSRYVGLVTPDRVFGLRKGDDWAVRMTDITYEEAVGICRILRTVFPQYEIYGARRDTSHTVQASTPFNVEIIGVSPSDADNVIREVRRHYYWLLTGDRIFITQSANSSMIEINNVPSGSINGLKSELRNTYSLQDSQIQ